MKTYSSQKLPTYQKIGKIVRVHWDYLESEKDGEPHWECSELVVPSNYTSEQAYAAGLPAELATGFLPNNFVEYLNE